MVPPNCTTPFLNPFQFFERIKTAPAIHTTTPQLQSWWISVYLPTYVYAQYFRTTSIEALICFFFLSYICSCMLDNTQCLPSMFVLIFFIFLKFISLVNRYKFTLTHFFLFLILINKILGWSNVKCIPEFKSGTTC